MATYSDAYCGRNDQKQNISLLTERHFNQEKIYSTYFSRIRVLTHGSVHWTLSLSQHTFPILMPQ